MTVPQLLNIQLSPFMSLYPLSTRPFLTSAYKPLVVLLAQLSGSSISLSYDVQKSPTNARFRLSSVSVCLFHEADSQSVSTLTSPILGSP